jgi:hypothetical protein
MSRDEMSGDEMSSNDMIGDTTDGNAAERIAGIHEDLPPGEHVLWQGAPSWWSLARHAFHIREVAAYFVLLAASSAIMDKLDGQPLTGAAKPLAVGAVGCLLLAFLAWLSSRTTTYAVTTRRVFLRVGIALPLTINLPLRRIEAAALAQHGDGCGDLPLTLEKGPQHLAFLHLWPHARPWRLKKPEPMMRSIAQPERVAGILADALQAAHAEQAAAEAPAATAETSVTPAASQPAPSLVAPAAPGALGVRNLHNGLPAGQQHGYGAAA